MPTKRVQHSRSTLRSLHEMQACHKRLIRNEQRMCEHDCVVERHYPKFYDDREAPMWWSQLVCRKCEAAYAALLDTPLCRSCHERTIRAHDTPYAEALTEALLAADMYATDAPVFRCLECYAHFCFALRIDTKKK